MFWNFWPLDLFFWFPIRHSLNALFILIWPFFVPFYMIWNFLPTISGLTIWLLMGFLLIISGGIFIFSTGLWITISLLYVVSIPDCLIVFGMMGFLTIILLLYGGLTGNSFSFTDLGKKAWLLTAKMKE